MEKSLFSCNTDKQVRRRYEQHIKGCQTWKQSLTLLQVELVNWFDLCFLKNVSLFKGALSDLFISYLSAIY